MEKKSIISQIFWGTRGTVDNIIESENFHAINDEIITIQDELKNNLSHSLWKTYLKIESLENSKENDIACTYFEEGFKVGCLVALEVMGSKD